MTHWTMPDPDKPRRPRMGDTIESPEVLNTLEFKGNHVVVRDSHTGFAGAVERVFVLFPYTLDATTFRPSSRGPEGDTYIPMEHLTFPLTVLWSGWDEAGAA